MNSYDEGCMREGLVGEGLGRWDCWAGKCTVGRHLSCAFELFASFLILCGRPPLWFQHTSPIRLQIWMMILSRKFRSILEEICANES